MKLKDFEQVTAEHKKLDKAIIHALAGATPETWEKIDLTVEVEWQDGGALELIFDFDSPEGHPSDEADVTDELSNAFEKLVRLYKQYGRTIVKIEGHAVHDASGWTYTGTFEYAPGEEQD